MVGQVCPKIRYLFSLIEKALVLMPPRTLSVKCHLTPHQPRSHTITDQKFYQINVIILQEM